MDISVILCTYNRCDSLRRTLETFCALEVPSGLHWELVLVDNNSTDGTRLTCEQFAEALPLQYVFDPTPGQSHARNCGIESAKADLLLFTDDDVDLTPAWLQSYWEAEQRYPQAVYFTGRVYPVWETPPPRWLAKHSTGLLHCLSLYSDPGDTERLLTSYEVSVPGCNMALRRSVFESGLAFDTTIGLRPNSEERGEDSQLIDILTNNQQLGAYIPAAVIHHRNSKNRMTEAYLRRWHAAVGAVEARRGILPARINYILGAPRYYWRLLLWAALRYACCRWTCPSIVWLKAEIEMARNWGIIAEYRRRG